MDCYLIHVHQFLNGLEIILRLKDVLLLVNMQFGVVGLCSDILSRDMMLADEGCDLLVSHVVFRLDFFAGVPFCQFWGRIVLDEIVVDASFGEAFLIPNSKDIYVLRFGNTVDGRFLDLVLLNNLINGVERTGFLWLGCFREVACLISFYEGIPVSPQYQQQSVDPLHSQFFVLDIVTNLGC